MAEHVPRIDNNEYPNAALGFIKSENRKILLNES